MAVSVELGFRLGIEPEKILGGSSDSAINFRRARCLAYTQQQAHHQITPKQREVTLAHFGRVTLPATWISGQLLVGYGGFFANQYPQLNYKRYLMLTAEKGRITKREFQDRTLWDQ